MYINFEAGEWFQAGKEKHTFISLKLAKWLKKKNPQKPVAVGLKSYHRCGKRKVLARIDKEIYAGLGQALMLLRFNRHLCF